ncbi:pentatricopeptide repeat-containing protein [Prunus yedoensis var. nudiflora]|uniref:Pentatricopeptide repeat-containing protein n=1 Tax=Prunus yedoensis var. nudiflora TaxID=2094558 RepID=A0A314YLG3_PRUYE|nr:pentatricopeptide repeat-containing protein [Prunus yedoensis var. nudiflora]
MKQKTAVSWNSMIDGYVQNEDAEEAMEIFQKMLDEGFQPTNVTIMEALHACADLGDLERGKFIHKLLDQLKLGSDVSVMNSLMSMYSKCKRVDIAAKIFKNLQGKTLVSWNTMILGYAQNGRVSEALSHFCQMQSQNMKPDSFTMVSVIPALAELSVTRQAKWIHGLVIRTCFDKNIFVMTALVDMYAKCGAVHTARKLFDMMDERHVTTWNAMIDGYGTNGLGKAAMPMEPGITVFGAMLGACRIHKNVELGERAADKIFELNPVEGGYHVLLANIYYTASLWDKVAKVRKMMMRRKGFRKLQAAV